MTEIVFASRLTTHTSAPPGRMSIPSAPAPVGISVTTEPAFTSTTVTDPDPMLAT